MPGTARAISIARATSASMSRPCAGRTWMVTSRATSDCHSLRRRAHQHHGAGGERGQERHDRDHRDQCAPGDRALRHDRRFVRGMRRRRARASIRLGVHRAHVGHRSLNRKRAAGPSCSTRRRASYWSIRPMSWVAITTVVPDLLSSTNSRSRRCARVGIDVAGRLVGEQQLRPRDHRARDRGALLLAARQHRRQRAHAVAEPDPVQQLDHLVAIARLVPAHHPERQRDVLVGGHVVEQPEILEHDADAPPQRRERRRSRRSRRRGRTP